MKYKAWSQIDFGGNKKKKKKEKKKGRKKEAEYQIDAQQKRNEVQAA